MTVEFEFSMGKYIILIPCIVVMTFPKGWAANFGWLFWEMQFNFGG